MARLAPEIVDATPLAGSQIDIPARIGWLLRTWRIARGVPLREMARLLPDGEAQSAATLSRLETLGVRDSNVIAAYETALGLPYGSLRAPIDVLCRTFAYAPADRSPYRPTPTLEGFDQACRAVEDGPDLHDWLRFAEYHTASEFGLPSPLLRPYVARLASEIGRSVGSSYQLRYEALAKLRCSAYGPVVRDVVAEAVTKPGTQVLNDAMSAVSEFPTAELLAWCGELLTHDSPLVAHGACLAIQNMRSVGGELTDVDWLDLAPVYAKACDLHGADPARGPILASTLATCPPAFRAAVKERLTVDLPAVRRPRSWSPEDGHYRYAEQVATVATAGRPGRALLTRLVFELIYDFRATHVVTSAFLAGASVFAPDLQRLLADAALHGPDTVTRHGAAYALANLMLPDGEPPDLAAWLGSTDPVIRGAGLMMAGHLGVQVDEDRLLPLITGGGRLANQALFAAGMANHPVLNSLSDDPQQPEDLRAAARWWLAEGGRIIH